MKHSKRAGNYIVLCCALVGAMGTRAAFAQVGPNGAPPPNVATAPTPAKFPNLSWNASLTANVTYDAYRGIQSGGPYGKVNAAPITVTNYRDTSASFGVPNFYVVIAKDSAGLTSTYSNEASATAIAPTAGSPAPPTQLNAVVALLLKVVKTIYAGLKFFGHIFS